jgi:hypothetical protein
MKPRTDPYLALLKYRNTPTQGLDSSPVMHLMSKRTRTLLPALSVLLEPVVRKNTSNKIRKNKEKQANQYNQRARDLGKLLTGDTVRFVAPRNIGNQAVKARVNSWTSFIRSGDREWRNVPAKSVPSQLRYTAKCLPLQNVLLKDLVTQQ